MLKLILNINISILPVRYNQTSTIRSILQIICKAHLEKSHSAGTFEQNNANFDDL